MDIPSDWFASGTASLSANVGSFTALLCVVVDGVTVHLLRIVELTTDEQ